MIYKNVLQILQKGDLENQEIVFFVSTASKCARLAIDLNDMIGDDRVISIPVNRECNYVLQKIF